MGLEELTFEDEPGADAALAQESPADEHREEEKPLPVQTASTEVNVQAADTLMTDAASAHVSRRRKRKPLLLAGFLLILLFAGALAAAYIYGIRHYEAHFLPNSLLDGVEIGEMTADEAREALSRAHDDHLVQLSGREGAEEILDIRSAQFARDYSGLEELLAAQDSRGWIMTRKPVKKYSLPYTGSYDVDGLQTALESSVLLQEDMQRKPADAVLTFDEASDHYVILPEDIGTEIDRTRFVRALEAKLADGDMALDLEDAGCYTAPEITSDDEEMNRYLRQLNTLQDLSFAVDLGAETVETMNGEELYDLIRTEGAVKDYVAEIARRYNTYDPDRQRPFLSQRGNYVWVQGAYGWQLDEEATLTAVDEAVRTAAKIMYGLEPAPEVPVTEQTAVPEDETAPDSAAAAEPAGQAGHTDTAAGGAASGDGAGEEEEEADWPFRVEAVWKKTAVSHSGPDFGLMYAEVDLSAQTVYIVQDGEAVFSSPCVSGRMTKGRITPGGIYEIKYKQTNKVLVGYKPDGSVDYRSPVSYWMPFNGGIGFHDATWRGSFGGNIYVSSGSHGCVNLPFSKAKEMYPLVYKGMPVILYY